MISYSKPQNNFSQLLFELFPELSSTFFSNNGHQNGTQYLAVYLLEVFVENNSLHPSTSCTILSWCIHGSPCNCSAPLRAGVPPFCLSILFLSVPVCQDTLATHSIFSHLQHNSIGRSGLEQTSEVYEVAQNARYSVFPPQETPNLHYLILLGVVLFRVRILHTLPSDEWLTGGSYPAEMLDNFCHQYFIFMWCRFTDNRDV